MEEGLDGYVYFFNSVAEGPMMSTMTLKHILMLLHIIHSYVPEQCIVETENLKPTFDKQGGLELLTERVQMTHEEWQELSSKQEDYSQLALHDVPADISFNLSYSQTLGNKYKERPVDVADIFVAPVCVSYKITKVTLIHSTLIMATANKRMQEGSNKPEDRATCFWLVMLKTRKCYNFNEHLRYMVNELDKEDRSNIKKLASRVRSSFSSCLCEQCKTDSF